MFVRLLSTHGDRSFLPSVLPFIFLSCISFVPSFIIAFYKSFLQSVGYLDDWLVACSVARSSGRETDSKRMVWCFSLSTSVGVWFYTLRFVDCGGVIGFVVVFNSNRLLFSFLSSFAFYNAKTDLQRWSLSTVGFWAAYHYKPSHLFPIVHASLARS